VHDNGVTDIHLYA
jgi:hypothetical protein